MEKSSFLPTMHSHCFKMSSTFFVLLQFSDTMIDRECPACCCGGRLYQSLIAAGENNNQPPCIDVYLTLSLCFYIQCRRLSESCFSPVSNRFAASVKCTMPLSYFHILAFTYEVHFRVLCHFGIHVPCAAEDSTTPVCAKSIVDNCLPYTFLVFLYSM